MGFFLGETMKRDKTEKLAAEAKAAGLDLIGPGTRPAYRLYRWIECGHVAERSTGDVRKKSIACQKCVDERHARDALAVGLKMLPGRQPNGYREYRWLSCGHTGRYQTSAVRIGSIMCRKCR